MLQDIRLAHLHARGLMHGDFYGHNLLWREGEGLMLGDFGAATPFDVSDRVMAERLARIEVRAWGCLLQELLQHLTAQDAGRPEVQSLLALQAQCMGPVLARPTWLEVKEKARQV